jgi:hypothetical protein
MRHQGARRVVISLDDANVERIEPKGIEQSRSGTYLAFSSDSECATLRNLGIKVAHTASDDEEQSFNTITRGVEAEF